MDRFNRLVQKYLIYCSPLPALGAIGTLYTGSETSFFSGNSPAYHVIGFLIVTWFVFLTYYFFAIALNKKLKDQFVRKLTGIRENDEREAQLTGSISQRTFVSMIAILILLLFLSTLRISIYRASPDEAIAGKTGTVSLGFGMDLVTNTDTKTEAKNSGRIEYFKYDGLHLSADGTILLMLLLELAMFFYFSRREFPREASYEG